MQLNAKTNEQIAYKGYFIGIGLHHFDNHIQHALFEFVNPITADYSQEVKGGYY